MNKPMTGSEIADELGISRQAVSQSLKKSMKKIYRQVKKLNLADTPFEIVLVMMTFLNINQASKQDVEEFYCLFPKDLQKEIRANATEIYGIKYEN